MAHLGYVSNVRKYLTYMCNFEDALLNYNLDKFGETSALYSQR